MSTSESKSLIRKVGVEEAHQMMLNGFDLVDVREDREWQSGHIPGAKHLPLSRILASPHAHIFRDNTIFVCAVGERSAVAAEMAIALGVQGVASLDGGTNAWRNAGRRVDVPQ